MHKRLYRGLVIAGMFLTGGYLFAGGSLGCGSMASEAGIASTDMCFIFDCTNGAFGGLLDPCGTMVGSDIGRGTGTGGGTGNYEGPRTGPLFADCPTDETPGA
jgi:hypothetical protein